MVAVMGRALPEKVMVDVYITHEAEEHGIRRVRMEKLLSHRNDRSHFYEWRCAPLDQPCHYYVGENCELTEEDARAQVRARQYLRNAELRKELSVGVGRIEDRTWPPFVNLQSDVNP